MDLNKKNPEADASQPIPAQPDRSIQVLVLVYCGLIFAYTLAVIAGQVPDDRKITIPNLLLLLFAGASLIFLVKPVALIEVLKRVTKLKLGEIEIQLDALKASQKHQKGELDQIKLLLPLLLKEQEISHLRNLEVGDTKGYTGNHDTRSELRRLRKIGLIEYLPSKRFSVNLRDNCNSDLAEITRLTPFGMRWMEKIKELDDEKTD